MFITSKSYQNVYLTHLGYAEFRDKYHFMIIFCAVIGDQTKTMNSPHMSIRFIPGWLKPQIVTQDPHYCWQSFNTILEPNHPDTSTLSVDLIEVVSPCRLRALNLYKPVFVLPLSNITKVMSTSHVVQRHQSSSPPPEAWLRHHNTNTLRVKLKKVAPLKHKCVTHSNGLTHTL